MLGSRRLACLLPMVMVCAVSGAAQAGVLRECMQGCRIVRTGCVEDVQEAYETRMVPDDPFPGYMPPPLDGIWATAPYLHNGSVPTVELVLNGRARPRFWKRVDFDSTHFDEDALGWPFEEVPYAQDAAPAVERPLIYDTTRLSQSNRGHAFGDHLTPEQRRAVIEYLKTL